MENVTTGSGPFVFATLSPPVTVVMCTFSCLIVLFNGCVFTCLVVRRHRFSPVYRLQLSCLSFNDLVIGIAGLLISCADTPLFMDNVGLCCAILWLFLASQCSALYNILGICISRLVKLNQPTVLAQVWRNKHTIAYTVAAWFLGITLVGLPFMVWSVSEDNWNYGCSLENVFRDKYITVMKMFGLIFILPLILTNILYTIAFMLFKKNLRKIAPGNREQHSRTSYPGNQDRHSLASAVTLSSADFGPGMLLTSSSINTTMTTVTSLTQVEELASNREPRALPSLAWALPSTTGRVFASIHQAQEFPSRGQHSVSPSSTVELDIHRLQKSRSNQYKRTFTVVSLILVFLNICTWPAILTLMSQGLGLVDTTAFTRDVKFPVFFTVAANSIINPILYTVMVSEVRKCLIESIVLCYSKATCVCKCVE